jgi:hypothetical protein
MIKLKNWRVSAKQQSLTRSNRTYITVTRVPLHASVVAFSETRDTYKRPSLVRFVSLVKARACNLIQRL